jgi:F0F1-type ATP synthase assembly protein I
MRVATALVEFVLSLLVGAWSGILAVAYYDRPWGWFLAVVGLSAAVFALPAGTLRHGFGVGWLAVLGLAVLGRSEGDWAIVSNAAGWGLIVVALLHLGFLSATLPVRRPSPGAAAT